MKAIIFNNIELAQELLTTINNSVKHLFDKNTTSFTYIISHPIEVKFAILIEQKQSYWQFIQNVINVNTIEEIDLKEWSNIVENENS